jgi:hypothetical protein
MTAPPGLSCVRVAYSRDGGLSRVALALPSVPLARMVARDAWVLRELQSGANGPTVCAVKGRQLATTNKPPRRANVRGRGTRREP